jgi:hypothetical protein
MMTTHQVRAHQELMMPRSDGLSRFIGAGAWAAELLRSPEEVVKVEPNVVSF